MNIAAMDIDVQIVIQDAFLNSFGYIPTSGISGSYDKSIFSVLRNHHNVFRKQLDF